MKISLVLEGGGMRGAYTAGVLTYLLEKNVTFDYGVGISAGAMNLSSFWMKREDYLKEVAVHYMSDSANVGMKPLLREGTYVGYNHMFDELLAKVVKYDLSLLNNTPSNFEIGLFNMQENRNDWLSKHELNLTNLKAACTLPIAGKPVHINGYDYMDGGIVTMVPIGRSIEKGNDKHFVIITKDSEYVRNPEPKIELTACKMLYKKTPGIVERLKVRHQVYYNEMETVEKMVNDGTAFLMRPTSKIPVARFKGDQEGLKACFELGIHDAKARWDEIAVFLELDQAK